MKKIKFIDRKRIIYADVQKEEMDSMGNLTYNVIDNDTGKTYDIYRSEILNFKENLDEAGTKFDDDKVRMDLLPVESLEEIAKGYTFGAKKYGDHNWRGGIKYSRLIGSTMRHFFCFVRGDDIDQESGINHLTLVGCNVLMLIYMTIKRSDLDDRYKK